MNRRRYSRRRWCRCIRRVAAGLGAVVFLGFLLLQVLLATPWMRSKVAGKLSQRIGGLEVVIGSLGWTPWNGVKIEDLEVGQPEALREGVPTPLLEVDEIHAWPDYVAAMKGHWTASDVKLLRPKFHLTADMLVSLAARNMPPVEPPAIAAVDPPPVPRPGPQLETTPASGLNPPRSEATPLQAPPIEDVPAKEQESAPKSETKVARERVRLVVEDGGVELVRVGIKERLLGIEGIDLDLPLFGEAGESTNSVNLITCLGQVIDKELMLEVKTEGSSVGFFLQEDTQEKIGFSGRVSFGLLAGLPFQVDLGLRLPTIGRVFVSRMVSAQCEGVEGRIQGGGWLQAPGSWRGVSAFEADKPTGWIEGQLMDFDSASIVVQLADGVIQSPDFRVIGDSASVLGNGWVTSRDGAAVVRLVVPYSAVGMVNDQLNQRVPESVFAFRPLNPDNRWYSDVSIWRGEEGWSVGFGDGGSVVPLDGFGKLE